MKRISILLLLTLLVASLPAVALAVWNWEPGGVGGGGWLYASAFHPSQPNEVYIGADMHGVMRSTDFGQTWEPWNDGLIHAGAGLSTYVQGFCIFEYQGTVHYYAATVGGIYHRTAGTPWQWETANQTQTYRNLREVGQPVVTGPISFSTIKFDGDHTLYAAAGTNRFSYYGGDFGPNYFAWSNGWTGYPENHLPNHEPLGDTDGYANKQLSVWTKDIGPGGHDWQPMDDKCTYYAARDLDVRRIGGTTYVVMTTKSGIYLHNGTFWINISDNNNQLVRLDGNGGQHLRPATAYYGYPYGDDASDPFWPTPTANQILGAWSCHLAADGTIYTACHKIYNDPEWGGGVYRYISVLGGDAGMWWYLTDDSDLDYGNGLPAIAGRSLYELCTASEFYDTNLQAGMVHPIFLTVVDHPGTYDELLLGSRSGGAWENGNGTNFGLFHALDTGVRPSWRIKTCQTQVAGNKAWLNFDPAGSLLDLDVAYQNIWGVSVIHEPAASSAEPFRYLAQMNCMVHTSLDGHIWDNKFCHGNVQDGWQTNGYNEMVTHDLEIDADGNIVHGNGDWGAFYQDGGDGFHHVDLPAALRKDVWEVEVVENWRAEGRTVFLISRGGTEDHLVRFHPATGTIDEINVTIPTPLVHRYLDLQIEDENHAYLIVQDAQDTDDGYLEVVKGICDPVLGAWTWAAVDPNGMVARPTCLVYSVAYGRLFAGTDDGIYCFTDGGRYWDHVQDRDFDNDQINDIGSVVTDLKVIDQGRRLYGVSYGSNRLFRATGLEDPDPDNWTWELASTPAEFAIGSTWLSGLDVVVEKPNVVYVAVASTNNYPNSGAWRYRWDQDTWINMMTDSPYYGVPVNQVRIDPLARNRLYAATTGLEILSAPIRNDDGGNPGDPNAGFRLVQGVLQPGAEGTAIHFSLPQASRVALDIYDLKGRRVRSVQTAPLAAGPQSITWDNRDARGQRCASGVYLLRLRAGDAKATGKITLVR